MSWRELEEEMARAREAGMRVEFWWRDDDATAPGAALSKLLELQRAQAVPLALAVIPLAARPEMFDGLSAGVLMHGTDHRNRAAAGEKKTEFPPGEGDDALIERLGAARERLARLAGARFVPVLAPPWNRFKRAPILLPAAGLHGLSGYGARARPLAAPGVIETNTHVDIIDWHGARGFVGEEAALALAAQHLAAKRSGAADRAEPTGWLTHHAVHDGAAWQFLERLFERTRRLGARWADARELFPSAS